MGRANYERLEFDPAMINDTNREYVQDYVNQVNAQKLAALKTRNWLLVGLGVTGAVALVAIGVVVYQTATKNRYGYEAGRPFTLE